MILAHRVRAQVYENNMKYEIALSKIRNSYIKSRKLNQETRQYANQLYNICVDPREE